MQAGEMSDLVAVGENLWIVRLLGVEESKSLTWDEARTAAENQLTTEHARALEAEILERWVAKLRIESDLPPAP